MAELHRVVQGLAGDVGADDKVPMDKLARWAKLIVKHRAKATIGRDLILYVEQLVERGLNDLAGQCLALAALALADPNKVDSLVRERLGDAVADRLLGQARKAGPDLARGAGLAAPAASGVGLARGKKR